MESLVGGFFWLVAIAIFAAYPNFSDPKAFVGLLTGACVGVVLAYSYLTPRD